MRRIAPIGEGLSSLWLKHLQRASTESSRLYTSQRCFPLRFSGHARHISSQGAIRAQHWESSASRTTLDTPRHDQMSIGINTVPQMNYYEDNHSPDFTSPQEEAQYAARFYQVVEDGQPDCLMTAMTDPRSAGLVGSLPQTTFVEALHRLSPAHFVEPFRDLHHPLHSWSVLLDGLKRAEVHFDEFVANLLTIVGHRVAFQPLQLAEYTHLLDCARSMGNAPLAREIWETMQRKEIAPNTTCYNYYMEALVWDHCYTGKEAYNLRMTPYHYKKRRKGADRSVGWRGFGTGNPNSVRHFILQLFNDMIQQGNLPDEHTYINLLVAGGRVGHRKGMRFILKTVWNIDIEEMKAQPDNSKLQPPTQYDPWSALYPTENLLFAVAHVYGNNNDIPAAIRIIQHISSTYDVPITQKVWNELLERAYVLGRARMKDNDSENALLAGKSGRIELELIQSLFNVMTSAPYNITPTLQACRYMLNIGIHNGNYEECKEVLQSSYKILQETRKTQTEARMVVLRCLKPRLEAAKQQALLGGSLEGIFDCPRLGETIQAYDIIRLQVYQQVHIFRRCCWAVLMIKQWNDISVQAWETQERPKFMEEWKDFLPEKKTLHLGDTGSFYMEGKTSVHSRSWACDSTRIPVRRAAHKNNLFAPEELRRLSEQRIWYHVHKRYPFLNMDSEHLKRLFRFEVRQSPKLAADISKLRSTWTEYPEDSPWGATNRPGAGFYGRLAALDMLKTEQRGIYYLSEGSWV